MATTKTRATVDRRAPTTEIGGNVQGGGITPWTMLVDTIEYVPELVWPTSVRTYERMRTDTQLAGLYAGATLPIRRYAWMIDPNGTDPAIVSAVAKELNLPIDGQEPAPKRRMQKRFAHDDHLRHSLLALIFGHMYFEQVGYIGDDGYWHLRKLAPRMPETIAQINVASDGGLISVKQNIGQTYDIAPEIPVDRLCAYVWEKEGPNWFGRSIFRECYKNWLIKDRLLRVDAINHERSGGVPVIEAPPDATPTDIAALNQMAQQFRIGDSSGGAIPNGSTLHLVSNSGPTTVDSIRYHDEAMARRFLMMFIQLGQTHTGSRALGRTFVEFFSLSQEVIANWYMDITNEHIIEDYVDWNFGNTDTVPLLMYKKEEDPKFAGTELAALITAGAITVDEELEDEIRSEMGLPDRMAGDPPPPGPPQTQPAATAPPKPAAGAKVSARRRRRR